MRRLLLLVISLIFYNRVIKACEISDKERHCEAFGLVEAVINRFEKIVRSSHGFKEELEIMEKERADFQKLPLGALVASSLNIVEKSESDEYKALAKLSDNMNDQFDRLGYLRSRSYQVQNMNEELFEFQKIVTSRLDILSQHILKFIDPRKAKSADDVNELVGNCTGDNGVEQMAEYIKAHVIEGCELNNTLVFVKVENMFYQLRQQFNDTGLDEDGKTLKRRILEIVYSNPSDQVLPELERIEPKLDTFSTISLAVEAVYNSMKHMQKQNATTCLTDAVFNGNMYARYKMSYYESLIYSEFARLIMVAQICGSFTFPNNTTGFEESLLNVRTNIEETYTFLKDYLPKKLRMSPRGVEKIIARKVIEDFTGVGPWYKIVGDIPRDKFYALSYLINEELEMVGPERIKKQVAVFPSEKTDSQFSSFYICPEYWCTTVLNLRGVDVMISRFETYLFETLALRDRRKAIEPSIVEVLKTEYNLPLPQLAEELKSRKNITLADAYYRTNYSKSVARSAAIIRHRTLCTVQCEYPTVVQEFKTASEIPATAHIKYSNSEDKVYSDDNTCHHILLFV